jgi:hypothetical protein
VSKYQATVDAMSEMIANVSDKDQIIEGMR